MRRPLPVLTTAAAAMFFVSNLAASTDENLCDGLVTHADPVPVKAVARPPHLQRYRDPAFGTTVVRITDSAQDEIAKPPYSTMQAWNADESLLLLYRSGGAERGHVLVDGRTYEPVTSLDIFPSDLEEVFWSHTEPDILFYISKQKRDFGVFYQLDVRSGVKTPMTDFVDICGEKMPVAGGDVHMQSLDDDLFGFRCRGESKEKYIAFSYRISNGETHQMPIGDGTPWRAWSAPVPAPSGKRMYFQGSVLSPDLSTVIHELDMAKDSEHANIGRTSSGHDAIFQVAFDPSPDGCGGDGYKGVGHVVEHDMETGDCRSVVSEAQGYPYTTSATHLSAQAYRRPGWVLGSSIGSSEQMKLHRSRQPVPALFSEIYLVNTDPDNTVVCRLAQHRSFGKRAEHGDYKSYFGEPHATLSPSGTRIVFASDWYDSGSVDSYVIELPSYQPPD